MRLPSPFDRGAQLTDIAFCAWLGQADPGRWLCYHRGFLVIDTLRGLSKLPEADRLRLQALADTAFRAFEAGFVHLVQLREAENCWGYVAIARKRPTPTPAILSALIRPDAEAA